MTTKLYPLKFIPILMDKIWGGTKLHSQLGKPMKNMPNIGESWELSGVNNNVSLVCNGFLKENDLNELIEIYMGDLVGDHVYEKFGNEFPLLIKFIDAREALSIQVHPNDELANKRHNSFGKTEMWYIMQADGDAYLISGFNQKITPQAYVKAVEEKKLENLLAKHKVVSGDIFFMPAGRVHAIGAGIMLAEIQQTSDITYRIYDFDRRDADGNTRELHTELAQDAIDYNIPESYRTVYAQKENKVVTAVESPFFVTNVLNLNRPVERDYYALDSFVILMCMEGSATIEYGDNEQEAISRGETVLIPADMHDIQLTPESTVKLLEVYYP
ncbi:MAG: class I mannose-6-phosphate isomerase [Cytophagaceae bacterium]|nr:class I mannose-6-phosphate isomerase [Cytophagaceae bacterium]